MDKCCPTGKLPGSLYLAQIGHKIEERCLDFPAIVAHLLSLAGLHLYGHHAISTGHIFLVICRMQERPCHFQPEPFLTRANHSLRPDRFSTTNIYYMIDKGPGCAYFIKQSDFKDFNAFFGHSIVGAKVVVVVDGHFPPPTLMPTVAVDTQRFPMPALDLIDTTPLPQIDLK